MNVHCQRVVNVWKNRGDPKDSRLEERVFSMLSFMKGLITLIHTWVFPEIGVPQNGWCIMENPIKIDDLGVPLFSETSTYS